MPFSNAEIAEYYDTTAVHYRRWWGLQEHKALHYGLWAPGIRTFGEALAETNRVMANAVGISSEDTVLDAGCGVGGASLYLAGQGTKVTGITLSEGQAREATQHAQSMGLQERVQFQVADYTQTPFSDGTFSVVWACESVCHAADKGAFLQEAYRLLAPGGRFVVMDFWRTHAPDPKGYVAQWGQAWGVPFFARLDDFVEQADSVGFTSIARTDYTDYIQPSARRLHRAAWWGQWGSKLYNLTHPQVSRFARRHYRSGLYQGRALRQGLWQYALVTATKAR